jgi:GDPmannose 4,6-dehydratase
VATGESHSVEEFVAAAFRCVGIDDWAAYVTVDPALFRPVDAQALTGDPTRIRTDLGWAPTVGFEDVVRRMVEADLALLSTQAPPPTARA